MEQFWYGKYLYTLSMGIKSSHPAKSTAASTAGGCWPTETKQTRRAVQLQSLPLIWRGKGSCETLSYLRHQMKGVIQQRHQSSPCRQRSSTFFPRSSYATSASLWATKWKFGRDCSASARVWQNFPWSQWEPFHWHQWVLDGPSRVLWPDSPSAAVSQMQGEVHQAAQVSTTACLQQRGRGQQEREGAAGRQLDLSAVRFLCWCWLNGLGFDLDDLCG